VSRGNHPPAESSGFAGTVEYAFKHELLRRRPIRGCSGNRGANIMRGSPRGSSSTGRAHQELAGLVAVHCEQAGELADAAEWHGRAGEQARTGYAPAAAIEHFQKALHLLASAGTAPHQRPDWYEGLSEALTTQGRFAEALATTAKRERWRNLRRPRGAGASLERRGLLAGAARR